MTLRTKTWASTTLGILWLALAACAVGAQVDESAPASAETVRRFQATEQALMDSIATGNKTAWDHVGG